MKSYPKLTNEKRRISIVDIIIILIVSAMVFNGVFHWRQRQEAKRHDLHAAIENNRYDQVKHLIDAGVDVNQLTKLGFTPLHLAAMMGQAQIAELLIKRGSYVNTLNPNGDTPLDLATQDRVREVLLGNGAKTGGPLNRPLDLED